MKNYYWRIFILTFFCLLPPVVLSADMAQKRVLIIIDSKQHHDQYAAIHRALLKSELKANEIIEIDIARTSFSSTKRQISRIRPHLVYAIGPNAYRLASEIIKDKPLIFSAVNLYRHKLSSNTYGISIELSPEMPLFMCTHLFPKIRTIGVLYSENNSRWFNDAKSKADKLGLRLHGKKIERSSEITQALRQLRVDAIWLKFDEIIFSNVGNLQTILNQRKPIIANDSLFSNYGAVLTIATDLPALGRQAASFAQSLLEQQPFSAKLQFPITYKVTVNLRKAHEYGIEINHAALSSIDKMGMIQF
ncbi:MAG: ABC transporter substrate binding protein [Pseudomonadota bacterium]